MKKIEIALAVVCVLTILGGAFATAKVDVEQVSLQKLAVTDAQKRCNEVVAPINGPFQKITRRETYGRCLEMLDEKFAVMKAKNECQKAKEVSSDYSGVSAAFRNKCLALGVAAN